MVWDAFVAVVDRVVGNYRLRKRKHPVTRVKQYLVEPMESTSGKAAGACLNQGELAI